MRGGGLGRGWRHLWTAGGSARAPPKRHLWAPPGTAAGNRRREPPPEPPDGAEADDGDGRRGRGRETGTHDCFIWSTRCIIYAGMTSNRPKLILHAPCGRCINDDVRNISNAFSIISDVQATIIHFQSCLPRDAYFMAAASRHFISSRSNIPYASNPLPLTRWRCASAAWRPPASTPGDNRPGKCVNATSVTGCQFLPTTTATTTTTTTKTEKETQ